MSDDLISRQATMDEISKQQTYKMFYGEDTMYFDANDVASVLASMPSVERKKGKWIDMNTLTTMYMPRYKCSICDEWANKSNYCPNCGADMRERREE